MSPQIARIIAKELGVGEGQVAATIQLIEEGASIPFIARYRKERTGGLDDTQLRTLAERFEYLTILNDRREVVLRSISEQGKLTPELEKQIRAAHDESRTRRSLRALPSQAPHQGERLRAKQASSRWPIACWPIPSLDPVAEALAYISADKGVENARCRARRRAQHPDRAHGGNARPRRRRSARRCGAAASSRSGVVKGKEAEGAKFSDYFEFDENIANMPSHRALALLRGEKEGVLKIDLDLPHDEKQRHPAVTSHHGGVQHLRTQAARPTSGWPRPRARRGSSASRPPRTAISSIA